jgi:Tol biopolymer transport system component
MRPLASLLSVYCALATSGLADSAVSATTERVSVSSNGVQGDRYSYEPSVSADGNLVAFASDASTLIANDGNGVGDVFVRDRTQGTTKRVSVSSGGSEGNGQSFGTSISADGRFVAFESQASNMVARDGNGVGDVFVHDRTLGTTERVSLSSTGVEGNAASTASAISPDGRFVVFQSTASNLVPGDTNGARDIFVRDRLEGATERVSVSSSGGQANGASGQPTASADGRFLAFSSSASNLTSGDTNAVGDVFVHDRELGTTERVSVSSGENQGNKPSAEPSTSADGRFVSFQTDASNLVAGDTNGKSDVFVRDRALGTTERVSVGSGGTQSNGKSYQGDQSSISADGQLVTFASSGSNLVAGDTNDVRDVFLRDRSANQTIPVSVRSSGGQANLASFLPVISADGAFLVFDSVATNLVSGDTNGRQDVFLRGPLP